MNSEQYLVVLLDEGEYVLATRTIFPSKEMAEMYADGCSKSRQPIVVNCWRGLDLKKFEFAHPFLFDEYSKKIAKGARK